MSTNLERPSTRRFIPVRLTDLPLEQRMKAAREVCKQVNEQERAEVIMPAIHPSRNVYWVAA